MNFSPFSPSRTIFRSPSGKRSNIGYERLADESSVNLLKARFEKARSLPAKVLFGSSPKSTLASNCPANAPAAKQAKKVSNVHPLLGLLDARRRKKATANPAFARYMEYMKEGGVWDVNTNTPVMHYK
ncbi:hypothetical protein Vadar_007637 [Vaccinium darrowii]|uniref:Uncharacterized protein n=1 Tax=Vaccinium darrowii TaxID=229202 RepID=A0ACB7Z2S4_9ERIC|nr:hypothetical protein Vadar_007637 [Vaccinium darrowii]